MKNSKVSTESREPTSLPGLLSTGQAAKILGFTRGTLFRWIKAGKIKAIRPNPDGCYRIPASEIDRLLELQK